MLLKPKIAFSLGLLLLLALLLIGLVVGKHRAIQIANKARPGEWLQDANGKWYKK